MPLTCEFHVINDPCEEPAKFRLAVIKRLGTVEMIQRVCAAAIEDAWDMVQEGKWDGFQVTVIR